MNGVAVSISAVACLELEVCLHRPRLGLQKVEPYSQLPRLGESSTRGIHCRGVTTPRLCAPGRSTEKSVRNSDTFSAGCDKPARTSVGLRGNSTANAGTPEHGQNAGKPGPTTLWCTCARRHNCAGSNVPASLSHPTATLWLIAKELQHYRSNARKGKGDRPLLCAAPCGPFRQKGSVPFSTTGRC